MARHAAPSNPTPVSLGPTLRERCVLALCADLFADPARLSVTLTHRITHRWTIAPHRHDDLLQLDLLTHCRGRAKVGGAWTMLSGMTAMVAPPGVEHGYELEVEEDGDAPPGRVYHLRLSLGPSLTGNPALLRALPEAFPALVTGLPTSEALCAAMRVVVRLGVVESARPPLLLARLTEVLCLWPGGSQEADDSPEELDRGLTQAVELIDQRMDNPPSLEEMAQVAHFSVRHFARRFQAVFGCTPHTYLTARRYAQAKQLLSQERLSISRIAGDLGFSSVATFSRWFHQQAGTSPTDFRREPGVM